jgi:hypothetical protein
MGAAGRQVFSARSILCPLVLKSGAAETLLASKNGEIFQIFSADCQKNCLYSANICTKKLKIVAIRD